MSAGQGRYEHSDAAPRPLVLAAFLLALIVGASMAGSAWLSQRFSDELAEQQRESPVRSLRRSPEGPELSPVPARELEEQRAWEERMLTGTEWVDPVNKIVRIPIEEAMRLTLREGFPVREGARK